MFSLSHILGLVICAIAAFVFGSFVEYWLHRMMHWFPKVFPTHPRHHINNSGQGFLWEFRDYILLSSVVVFSPFLISFEIGLSWFIGSLAYAAFASYAHQLQHDNPKACFWMRMPVHYVHHEYNQWHHNFGLALDWWDFIFGTYKEADDWVEEKAQDVIQKSPLELKWY